MFANQDIGSSESDDDPLRLLVKELAVNETHRDVKQTVKQEGKGKLGYNIVMITIGSISKSVSVYKLHTSEQKKSMNV